MPLPLTKPWMYCMCASFSLGLILWIYTAAKCSELTEDKRFRVLPTEFQNTPCFSEANGEYAGAGFFTAVFLSAGTVGCAMTLLYKKMRERMNQDQSRVMGRGGLEIDFVDPPRPKGMDEVMNSKPNGYADNL